MLGLYPYSNLDLTAGSMVAKRADKPVPAKPVPDVLQDEETAFPRGGGSTISALDRRRIKAEAQADAERDFFAEASAAKRRKLGTSQVCLFVCIFHPTDTGGVFCWDSQQFLSGPTLFDWLQDTDLSFVSRGIASKPPKYVDLLKLKVLLNCSCCSKSTAYFKPAVLQTSAPWCQAAIL